LAKLKPEHSDKIVQGLLENHNTEEEPLYRISRGDYAWDIDLTTLAISFDNGVHWRSIAQVQRTWR
jgi:hypothetical protein